MKELIKHIYRVLNPKFQTVNLDYPVETKPRYTSVSPHAQLLEIIEAKIETYKEHLNSALSYISHFQDLQIKLSSTGFQWRNDYLPAWDTIMLYTMLGLYKPRSYVEVGSGYSTFVTRQAIRDHHLATTLTSIDPHPRASIEAHCDQTIPKRLEDVGLDIFSDLSSGDILFIDNSHRLLPNSDVTVFFLDVLPRLRPGVILHIHDIYLPYDYPQHSSLSQILDPVWQLDTVVSPEGHGGSFWFKIL